MTTATCALSRDYFPPAPWTRIDDVVRAELRRVWWTTMRPLGCPPEAGIIVFRGGRVDGNA